MTAEACIPLPLQIVIDDVGWRHGRDGSQENQPYRTGLDRLHGPADYRAIVRLGRELGMRPQAVMILGDWDTQNRLRKIPTASWLGDRWDNSPNVGPWMAECAEIIHNNPTHLEVVVHGIMHEYWLNGVLSRAEYHDLNGVMRPRQEIIARLDLFFELVEQHRFGSVPRSLLPPCYCHNFGAPGENFAELVQPYGIQSIFSVFDATGSHTRPLDYEWFGFDRGLIAVQRKHDLFQWNHVAPVPEKAPYGPVCSMHWPHILHADPARNGEIVDGWVRVLKPLNQAFDRLLSPSTEAFLAQLVHHTVTTVKVTGDELEVDASEYYRLPWKYRPELPVTVKVRRANQIESLQIKITSEKPILRQKLK